MGETCRSFAGSATSRPDPRSWFWTAGMSTGRSMWRRNTTTGSIASTSSITRLVQALSKWKDPMVTHSTSQVLPTHLTVLFAAQATLQQMIGYHHQRRLFQFQTSLAGVTPET